MRRASLALFVVFLLFSAAFWFFASLLPASIIHADHVGKDIVLYVSMLARVITWSVVGTI